MKQTSSLILLLTIACWPLTSATEQITLKQHLSKVSGASAWNTVKEVQFTWQHVPKNISRSYVWRVHQRTVKATISGKTTTIKLTDPKDQKTSAYKAFINDSYWPFFMLHATTLDQNVTIKQLPVGGKLIKGGTISIEVAYGNVGPSPKDTYYVHLNPKYRDVGWMYKPAGSSSPRLITTREKHQTIKGITVPTAFKTLKGKTVVNITNLTIK